MSLSEDVEAGWISRQEIRNVFIEATRQLDKFILPDRTFPGRDLVISHFESTMHALLQKSKPASEITPKKTAGTKVLAESPVDSRLAHQERISVIRQRSL